MTQEQAPRPLFVERGLDNPYQSQNISSTYGRKYINLANISFRLEHAEELGIPARKQSRMMHELELLKAKIIYDGGYIGTLHREKLEKELMQLNPAIVTAVNRILPPVVSINSPIIS